MIGECCGLYYPSEDCIYCIECGKKIKYKEGIIIKEENHIHIRYKNEKEDIIEELD